MYEYVEKNLLCSDVYLVFDRYKKFSIKGSTRSDRAKKVAYQLKFTLPTPLPCREKNSIMFIQQSTNN